MTSLQLQNVDVLARLKPFGISFEKSLTDLIKGIRVRSKDSPESVESFLELAVIDCRNELQSHDLESKAMAVLKLAYLEMYGFDMAWCSFHILEVMSSPKLQHKRIGYLLAIQTFSSESELFILATNQFKKDLGSHNHIEVGLALSGIAATVTPSLAKDINDDVLIKLNHTKPYIRKKAMLCMYKIFLQYPDSLRDNFDRIIQRLDDSETAVVSATVNVICEISKLNPKIFIHYLPRFFAIFEEAQNNWLVIRILKLFTSLSKVEPRIKKKILPMILNLMEKTLASSLTYECINCIVRSNMLSPDSSKDKECARLCVSKLMDFFAAHDPNLKYVGLLVMISILQVYPSLICDVEGIQNVVMECFTEPDSNIKSKAIEISHHLVSESNIVDVIKLLLVQLIPKEGMAISDSLQAELVFKIIEICLLDNYAMVPNFSWYVAVLKDMVKLTLLERASADSYSRRHELADVIAQEFTNLATKVPSIRADLLNKVVFEFVQDPEVMEKCLEILGTFYWIMGEYACDLSAVDDDDDDDSNPYDSLQQKTALFEALVNFDLDEKAGTSSHPHYPVSPRLCHLNDVNALLILTQALVKLFSTISHEYALRQDSQGSMSANDYWDLAFMLYKLIRFLNNWLEDMHYEVQERAVSWLEFLKLALEAMTQEESNVLEKMDLIEIDRLKVERSEDADDNNLQHNFDESNEDLVELSEDGQPEPRDVAAPIVEAPVFGHQTYHLPALVSQVLPNLFNSYQLNPIARNTQRKIALPQDLDLELNLVLTEFDNNDLADSVYNLYISEPDAQINSTMDNTVSEKELRKQKRHDQYVNDPFYIQGNFDEKNQNPLEGSDQIISDIEMSASPKTIIIGEGPVITKTKKPKKVKREKVLILNDETIESRESENTVEQLVSLKPKRNALKIDSSILENFTLDSPSEVAGKTETADAFAVDLEQMRENLAKPEALKKKKKKALKANESESLAKDKTKKPRKKKAVIAN